jgi:hypothetical protein
MWHLIHKAFRHVDRWDGREWLVALVIVLTIGFICMRGMGSRSKY